MASPSFTVPIETYQSNPGPQWNNFSVSPGVWRWTNTKTGYNYLGDAAGNPVAANVDVTVGLQAPPVEPTPMPPTTAMPSVGGMVGGVMIQPKPLDTPPGPNGIDWITNQPIYSPPLTATVGNPTTSKQTGDNPGPTPPVGTKPPTFRDGVKPSAGVAPRGGAKHFVIFALVILVLAYLAGVPLRKVG